jgi:DNA-3-methyladenine glycosylase
MKLSYDFYNRHVVEVAKELLGKRLVWGPLEGIITETEAYRGIGDAASHAARGLTPRTKVMFGPPGRVYVYLIYGMYHCLNIVTESPGQAGAVLIRAIQLPQLYLNGPGKVCRYFEINKSHNGLDLTSHDQVYITEGVTPISYITTPRIGITKDIDKPWRFLMDVAATTTEETGSIPTKKQTFI